MTRDETAKTYYGCLETPLGNLLVIAGSQSLREIRFLRRGSPRAPSDWIDSATSSRNVVGRTLAQLTEYFAGRRRAFRLPLAPEGTAFQQRVWKALFEIDYGQITTYGEIARRIGAPLASRAVGAANGSNPIPIVIPCHRVIGASGTLTGYGGGLDLKEKLLQLEGVPIASGRRGSPARVQTDQMRMAL